MPYRRGFYPYTLVPLHYGLQMRLRSLPTVAHSTLLILLSSTLVILVAAVLQQLEFLKNYLCLRNLKHPNRSQHILHHFRNLQRAPYPLHNLGIHKSLKKKKSQHQN